MALEMGFNFYQSTTEEFLSFNVETDGTLFISYINTSAYPITGTYDYATRAVNFRTGGPGRPGVFDFLATYYSGYAILDSDGNIVALAGTYRELGIVFEPSGADEVLGGWYATVKPTMN